MNNLTSFNSTNWFMNYSSYDIEMVNMIQSSVSCLASVLILIKVFDVSRFFKSVQQKRNKMKRDKERKELERVRKLINSVKSNNDVDLNELLSSGDDDEETEANDAGVMKIARKKKNNLDEKV